MSNIPHVTISSDDNDKTVRCGDHIAPIENRREPTDPDVKNLLILAHDDPATGRQCAMTGALL